MADHRRVRILALGVGGIVVAAVGLRARPHVATPDMVDVRPAVATPMLPVPWAARSVSGTTVRVTPSEVPVRAGWVELDIRCDADFPAESTLTLDLVSPTMPMHGITRWTAERRGPRAFSSRLEIPMEGAWALYVNIGGDADPAVVEFTAAPSPSGAAHEHAAHAGH